MSIVVTTVNQDTGVITMAADSQATLGDDTKVMFSKLFSTPLGMVIGVVGQAEALTLIRMYANSRVPDGVEDADIYAYYLDFKKWASDNDPDFSAEHSTFHIAFNGHAFSVEGGLIQHIEHFSAIGAGGPYAIAALHLGHSAQEAVEVACDLNIFCSPPIQQIDMLLEDEETIAEQTWTDSAQTDKPSSTSSGSDSSTVPTSSNYSGTPTPSDGEGGNPRLKTFHARRTVPGRHVRTSRDGLSQTVTYTRTSSARRRSARIS